jgi:peroxiredoxin
LLALCDTMYLEPTDQHAEQVKRLRKQGIAWFGKADVERARCVIGTLEGLLATKQAEQTAAGDKAEADARAAAQPDDQVAKARTDAMNPFTGQIQPVESALAELRGHLAMAEGRFPEAFELFDKAGGMTNEVLSRARLQAGNLAEAEQLAKGAVDSGRNQVYPLANYVNILAQCGKSAEAAEAFKQLEALSARIDLDAPVFQRLASVAASLGKPADWRIPPAVPADAGVRPPFDSLGPIHWHPPTAPGWTLPDASGKPVSLADFQGRPVVVILYLGLDCPHCLSQLQAFGPAMAQYAEAGISLVAIGTQPVDALQAGLAARPAGELPFPLLADSELGVFRSYKAHDDFEGMPLHGTYLIDGQGRVRWRDISFEPFADTAFLLAEAKRLLSIP